MYVGEELGILSLPRVFLRSIFFPFRISKKKYIWRFFFLPVNTNKLWWIVLRISIISIISILILLLFLPLDIEIIVCEHFTLWEKELCNIMLSSYYT